MNRSVYILLIIILLINGCRPEKESGVIRIGLSHSKSHSFARALEKFGQMVEERSSGRYKVQVFYSAQIGSEKEMQEMLSIGSLDICVSGILNTYEPRFTLFEMPYLYRDREHIFEVMNSPVMEEVSSTLKNNGIILLGFYENGFRNISTTHKKIEKPGDLRGLKIRTPENPAQIQTIKSLGAIATPLSFSELYTALVQGVVDGQENPLQNIWSGRLYESQKYIAMTHHIYNSAYLIGSMKFWEKMVPDDREMIRDCVKRSSLWQLEYMKKLDAELMEKMKNEGVIFTYPDRKLFENATLPAYDAIYEMLGPGSEKMVKEIREIGEMRRSY